MIRFPLESFMKLMITTRSVSSQILFTKRNNWRASDSMNQKNERCTLENFGREKMGEKFIKKGTFPLLSGLGMQAASRA
jgi:hypothetical protein